MLATTPSHPVLKYTLESMVVDWYYNPTVMAIFNVTMFDPDIFYHSGALGILKKSVGHGLMGPGTMYKQRISEEQPRNSSGVLHGRSRTQ